MRNIRNPDFESSAVISLCVLWVSTTFAIALMEIALVGALVLWGLGKWSATRKQHPVLDLGGAKVNAGCSVGGKDRLMWGSLAVFCLIVLLSFFFSEYPKQSFRGIFKIAKPILVFIMAASLFRTGKAQSRFDVAFLITFLIVTLDSSVQYAFGRDVLRGFPAQASSAGLRLVGPFGDFGKMGAYLILIIPVFLLQGWSKPVTKGMRRDSLYALLLAAAGFVLLYLTRCRGPVLALVVSFFALALYKRWFKAIGIGFLLFLAILAITPRGMIIHLDAESKEQSIIERLELAKRAFDVIKARPWLGTGINTYNVAHEKYDTTQNWRVRGYYAHNGYLQLAAEIGIPGIFFFILFLILFFKRGLREAKAARGSPEELEQLGILTGLLAFLLYAMADTNLQSPQSLMSFWFMAGVLMARQKPQLP